jgi:hypothetical protein
MPGLSRAGVIGGVALLAFAVVLAPMPAQAFAPAPTAPSLPTMPARLLTAVAGDAAEAAELAGSAGTAAGAGVATTAIGVGGGVLGALSAGFYVGQSGVNLLWKPVTGSDLKDTICVGGGAGEVLGFLYQQDCSGALAASTTMGFVPNSDQASVTDYTPWVGVQVPAGSYGTATLYGIGTMSDNGTTRGVACFRVSKGSTGSSDSANEALLQYDLTLANSLSGRSTVASLNSN